MEKELHAGTGSIQPKRKPKWPLLLMALVIFAAGAAGGYLFLTKGVFKWVQVNTGALEAPPSGAVSYIRVYYPVSGHLQMEERSVAAFTDREDAAYSALKEYLKGPVGMGQSAIPHNVRVLNVYFGTDGILYVELSDEFRSNFQGDAVSEFLLLRGLYETMMSNVEGISDVRLLIEGKEVESIGGHIYADRPLGELALTGKGPVHE